MNELSGRQSRRRPRRPSVRRSVGGQRTCVRFFGPLDGGCCIVRPIKRAIAAASVFLLPNQHHDDATRFPKFGAVFLGESFDRANASRCGRMALLFRLKKYLLRCAWRAKRIDWTDGQGGWDGGARHHIIDGENRMPRSLPDKSFWKKVGNEGARDENGQRCIP